MRRHPVLKGLVATACALGIGVGAALGLAEDGPAQIDPDSLTMPSKARSPWVNADGTIDEARAPDAHQDWRLPDGRIDCRRAPATMSIATFDGRILLDEAGREVQMPALSGCEPAETPELARAWVIRATRLQEADARRRGIAVPPPPQILVSPEPPLPPGGIAPQGGTP